MSRQRPTPATASSPPRWPGALFWPCVLLVAPSLHGGPRRRPLASAALGLALSSLCVGACERAPAPEICPRVDAGQLVISELRGDQAGQDSIGPYLEIYNAAGRSVDLQGLVIRQIALDGDEVSEVIRENLEIAAGGYGVIDWDTSSFSTGFFEIEACDALIDRVGYAVGAIPSAGTLACGDAETPPDADANDEAGAGCWCVDAEPADPNFPSPGVGLPGTPGRANRCP